MKAVIPVAGVGSRLRPHTHTQPKSLVPVAGQTILGHIIERLLAAGVHEMVFIIGYLGDKIKAYVHQEYPRLRAEFVVQEPREGLGHALWVARETYRHEKNILIVLGDTIVEADLTAIMDHPHSVLAVKKVAVPELFGVAEVGPGGQITRIIEKPLIPKSNLALVGLYKIASPARLVEALSYILTENIRTQGEYHLSDALMHLIRKGEVMEIFTVNDWFDCGRKETLLEANTILLHRPDFISPQSADFPGSIILPPVSIGRNCTITRSIIGPNVAIGDHTVVDQAIVQDSIIGSDSVLRKTVLFQSIIGNDASLEGLSHSLNIGDNAEIKFN